MYPESWEHRATALLTKDKRAHVHLRPTARIWRPASVLPMALNGRKDAWHAWNESQPVNILPAPKPDANQSARLLQASSKNRPCNISASVLRTTFLFHLGPQDAAGAFLLLSVARTRSESAGAAFRRSHAPSRTAALSRSSCSRRWPTRASGRLHAKRTLMPRSGARALSGALLFRFLPRWPRRALFSLYVR